MENVEPIQAQRRSGNFKKEWACDVRNKNEVSKSCK